MPQKPTNYKDRLEAWKSGITSELKRIKAKERSYSIPGIQGFVTRKRYLAYQKELQAKRNENLTNLVNDSQKSDTPLTNCQNDTDKLSIGTDKLANKESYEEAREARKLSSVGKANDPQKSESDKVTLSGQSLNPQELYLLEEGAKNIALWGATILPNHISSAFGAFHHELFADLYELITGYQKTESVKFCQEDSWSGWWGGDAPHTSRDTKLDSLEDCHSSGIFDYFPSRKGAKKLVIAAPRGHAKTTCLMVFVLWCLCYQMRKYVLLVSDSEDQAKLQLDAIKAEIESNELLRRLYGDLVGPYWGLESIETSTGIRVQCRGAGQKIRGLKFRASRPDLICVDDLLNDELCETEERRVKIRRWFFGALMPALSRDGCIAVAGTRLHEADLLSDLLEGGVGWKKRRYEASGLLGNEIVDPVLWPELWSVESLKDLREEYAEKGEVSLFYREMYNRIVSNESSPFRREYFKYKEHRDLEGLQLRNFLTIDPAYTLKKGSDYTVFCVVGLDYKRNWYVKALIRGHWAIPKIVEQWFEVVNAYRPVMIGMQSVDWSRVFKSIMKDEMNRRGEFFVVKELQTYSPIAKGLSNKTNRIARLSKFYTNGAIWHVKDGLGMEALEQELLAFPHSKKDDCADALSQVVDLAFPPQLERKRELPKFMEDARIDPVSGY